MYKTLAIALALALTGCAAEAADEEPRTPTPTPTSAEAQGITEERAEELWATITSDKMAPIIHAYRCEPRLCVIQVNPGPWAGVPYDTKRDFVTGAGKAAAVLHQADWTEVQDAYSGKEYATYSARSKSVRMK